MPNQRASNSPTCALSDGNPVTAEQVEAELRGRVTSCEEALEDAIWQLARFYSSTWKRDVASFIALC
jgi:hypothetical protein